eukprot:9478804-Pyramimonas_sp.AAC.1
MKKQGVKRHGGPLPQQNGRFKQQMQVVGGGGPRSMMFNNRVPQSANPPPAMMMASPVSWAQIVQQPPRTMPNGVMPSVPWSNAGSGAISTPNGITAGVTPQPILNLAAQGRVGTPYGPGEPHDLCTPQIRSELQARYICRVTGCKESAIVYCRNLNKFQNLKQENWKNLVGCSLG